MADSLPAAEYNALRDQIAGIVLGIPTEKRPTLSRIALEVVDCRSGSKIRHHSLTSIAARHDSCRTKGASRDRIRSVMHFNTFDSPTLRQLFTRDEAATMKAGFADIIAELAPEFDAPTVIVDNSADGGRFIPA